MESNGDNNLIMGTSATENSNENNTRRSRNDCESVAKKSTYESLMGNIAWNWLMSNRQQIQRELMPFDPETPRTKEEAILHFEKGLEWLKNCNEPTVTSSAVLQLKKLINNLKASANKN